MQTAAEQERQRRVCLPTCFFLPLLIFLVRSPSLSLPPVPLSRLVPVISAASFYHQHAARASESRITSGSHSSAPRTLPSFSPFALESHFGAGSLILAQSCICHLCVGLFVLPLFPISLMDGLTIVALQLFLAVKIQMAHLTKVCAHLKSARTRTDARTGIHAKHTHTLPFQPAPFVSMSASSPTLST